MATQTLVAGAKNKIEASYAESLTGWQGILRIRNEIGNSTDPELEMKGTLTVSGSTTIVEFIFDLPYNTTIKSGSYYQIELNNAATLSGTPTLPEIFFEIGSINIISTFRKKP
jgi:hypothetical protein